MSEQPAPQAEEPLPTNAQATPTDPQATPETAHSTPEAAQRTLETEWQRLSPRYLLPSALGVSWSLFPIAAPSGYFIIKAGEIWWLALLVLTVLLLAAVLAVPPWYCQGYRVHDSKLQVRQGVFKKTVIHAQIERVRTVDSQANLLQRLLGLVDLTISTGSDNPLQLKGIDKKLAVTLRQDLLRRKAQLVDARPAEPTDPDRDPAAASATGLSRPVPSGPVDPAGPPDQVLATFQQGWLRFAPLTMIGPALVGGAVAAVYGIAETFNAERKLSAWTEEQARTILRGNESVPLLVVQGVLIAVLLMVVLSLIGYVLKFWMYRLVRRHDGTVHVTQGLINTAETTVEEQRVRGAVLETPVLLSLIRGARGTFLLSGASESPTNSTVSDFLHPPAPAAEASRAIAAVLDTDVPLTMVLTRHGSAATRRRLTRAAWGPLTVLVPVLLALVWWFEWDRRVMLVLLVPVVTAPVVGWLRARRLGHAVSAEYLVASEGLFPNQRRMLRSSAIIGWSIGESWFQRRSGVVTLCAAAAVSSGEVRILDVPRELVVPIIRTLTPELVDPYLEGSGVARPGLPALPARFGLSRATDVETGTAPAPAAAVVPSAAPTVGSPTSPVAAPPR